MFVVTLLDFDVRIVFICFSCILKMFNCYYFVPWTWSWKYWFYWKI